MLGLGFLVSFGVTVYVYRFHDFSLRGFGLGLGLEFVLTIVCRRLIFLNNSV